MTEKTGRKQRGKPFEKGRSGNPAGKPRGARHKTTLAVESLLNGEAEKLTRKAIEKALEGDGVALRLCLDRIAPARRDNPVRFAMPQIACAADAAKVMGAVVAAVAVGDLTPIEAGEVAKIVGTYVASLEATEFEARLAALEGMPR